MNLLFVFQFLIINFHSSSYPLSVEGTANSKTTAFNQNIAQEFGLSNIEKFNHLLNYLQGQALETAKAFQITNENFPKALARLKARYDNSTLIFSENIMTLFELSTMSKSNSAQLKSLVDTFTALYSSLLSLDTQNDIANSMLI